MKWLGDSVGKLLGGVAVDLSGLDLEGRRRRWHDTAKAGISL